MDKKKVLIPIFFGLLMLIFFYYLNFAASSTLAFNVTRASTPTFVGNTTIYPVCTATVNASNFSIINLTLHIWKTAYPTGAPIYNITNTSAVINGTAYTFIINTSSNFSSLGNGNYSWGCDLKVFNKTGNSANLTLHNNTINNGSFVYDDNPPYILNLTYPVNNNDISNATDSTFTVVYSNATIPFNFTSYDLWTSLLTCNLYVNGITLRSGINFTNATNPKNITIPATNFTGTISPNLYTTSYFWNVTCSDEAGNSNSNGTSNLSGTIVMGATFRLFDRQAPYKIEPIYPNASEIKANATAASVIGFNLTVYDKISYKILCNLTITNLEGGNSTTFTAVNNTFWNLTTNTLTTLNVPLTTIGNSGWHNYSIFCKDLGGLYNNSNMSDMGVDGNFTITDTVSPTPGTPTFSSSSVTAGSTVTVTCPVATDNVDANPVETVYYRDPSNTQFSSTNTNPYSWITTVTGTYTAYCGAIDDALNSATGAQATFAVTAATAENGGGAGGGGGGGTTTPVETVLSGQTADIGTVSSSAVSVSAYRNSNIGFKIAGNDHTAHVDEVSYINKKVTLTISSDPVTVIISEGETKSVDLNADGTNDLEVKVTNIDKYGKASISFKYLTPSAEEVTPTTTPTTGGQQETKAKVSWIWWAILVIIVVIIIIYLATRKGKK